MSDTQHRFAVDVVCTVLEGNNDAFQDFRAVGPAVVNAAPTEFTIQFTAFQQQSKPAMGSVCSNTQPVIDYDREDKQWFVARNPHVRECFSKFLGTFVVIAFGMGVNNHVVLPEEKESTWRSTNMAWGIAVLMGVYCSEGVSGAHMNPSVTLAHAVSSGSSSYVHHYVLDYQRLMKADTDKETMHHNFVTHPDTEISNFTAFYTEVLATGLALLCVFASMDQRNRSLGTVGVSFVFALMTMALGMSLSMNTGYPMNPARDFAPRLFMFFTGYGSKVFTENSCYFLIPMFAPLIGGVLGAGAYELLVQVQHPNDPAEHQEREFSHKKQPLRLK